MIEQTTQLQTICNMLKDTVDTTKFNVFSLPIIESGNKTYRPDILVSLIADGSTICAIEIGIIKLSNGTSQDKAISDKKRYLHQILDSTKALFAVLTDGQECIIVQPLQNSEVCYYNTTIDTIPSYIENFSKFQIPPQDRNELIKKMIAQLTKSSREIGIEKFLSDFMTNSAEPLIVQGNSFSLPPVKELAMINSILGTVKEDKLYRYTSINSLMRIIYDRTDSMCGLAVMNDKSECYLIENLIFHLDNKNLSLRSKAEIKELNSYFINSLSQTDPMNDLTMWRLYGNDGRGICIEYEINKEVFASNDNFYLSYVDYTGEKAKKSKAVKALADLYKARRIHGYKFCFSQIDIWKHFFKPKHFEVEKEIRLMYVRHEDDKTCTEKWMYNEDYSIIHPIIVFKRDEGNFPLIIKKIILGPKFEESDTNIAQLLILLENSGMQNVEIEKSQIEFYR